MSVVTVTNWPENINNLKQLTGTLNFVIRIQDYKTSECIMQCFKCKNFAIRPNSATSKIVVGSTQGLIIRGIVWKMLHNQLGVQNTAGNTTPGEPRGTKIQGKAAHYENSLQASTSKEFGHRFQGWIPRDASQTASAATSSWAQCMWNGGFSQDLGSL